MRIGPGVRFSAREIGGLILLVLLLGAAGCAPGPATTARVAAPKPTLVGAVSEATETVTVDAPPLARKFTSPEDADWYKLAKPVSGYQSFDATVLASARIRFFDSNQQEIGSTEYNVSPDGWQTASERLDERTTSILVTPLDGSEGTYSLQLVQVGKAP